MSELQGLVKRERLGRLKKFIHLIWSEPTVRRNNGTNYLEVNISDFIREFALNLLKKKALL
jgi:hypothetical protein